MDAIESRTAMPDASLNEMVVAHALYDQLRDGFLMALHRVVGGCFQQASLPDGNLFRDSGFGVHLSGAWNVNRHLSHRTWKNFGYSQTRHR